MLTKMFKMMKKGNKGFTLVELMVVVVIIGVLTAIAVPIYNNATEKAKLNAIAANLRIINGAIGQYQANNNGSNPNETQLAAYIQEWPKNPSEVEYKVGTIPTGDTFQGYVEMKSTIKGLTKGQKYYLKDVLNEIDPAPAGGGGST